MPSIPTPLLKKAQELAVKHVVPLVVASLPADKVVQGQRSRMRARDQAKTLQDGYYMEVFLGANHNRHWVVWAGDKPVAAHPPFAGDLVDAVKDVDLSRRKRSRGSGSGELGPVTSEADPV